MLLGGVGRKGTGRGREGCEGGKLGTVKGVMVVAKSRADTGTSEH